MKPRILLNIDEIEILIEYHDKFSCDLLKYKPTKNWYFNRQKRLKRAMYLYEILNKYWPK